jgi:predicted nucleotidyltransferase
MATQHVEHSSHLESVREVEDDYDIEPYLTRWRQRQRVMEARRQRLTVQARQDAAQIAAMLRRDFGVTRVLLFGSLVKGKFNTRSDIDLVVADLPPDLLFLAIAQAGKLSEFPIDLKPLEALSEHFLRRVLETGEEI